MIALPRLMISAAHKSSGKTIVTSGLARAMSNRTAVQTFKKGPDYIDPLWLATASKSPCYNLDFNTMDKRELTALFVSRANADMNLIEANKGLFDGVSEDGSDSNAALAKLLNAPVVLVIDTVGMSRGVAPLLQGYAGFDPDVNVAGVILNRTGGPRHEGKLCQSVEAHTDIPVLGAIRRSVYMDISERHLGLITPAENPETESWLDLVAELVSEQVEMDWLRQIANDAPPMHSVSGAQQSRKFSNLRIGIARDAAFGFYYSDDLEAMQDAGATLIPIDMTAACDVPDIDGLFIGGGFPETQMDALERNTKFRLGLKRALINGLPCYAECGGLMYLCRSITYQGRKADMVGFFDADTEMLPKPIGRGYARFRRKDTHPWGTHQTELRAHEFHYARVINSSESGFCRTVTRGYGTDGQNDGLSKANTMAGFIHMRNSAQSPWVSDFLNFVQSKK